MKSPENNYREYQLSDLMTLSDIIFYKNLGIPLKQILEMKKTTPDEHRLLFQEKLIDLDRQRQELEQRGLTISPRSGRLLFRRAEAVEKRSSQIYLMPDERKGRRRLSQQFSRIAHTCTERTQNRLYYQPIFIMRTGRWCPV